VKGESDRPDGCHGGSGHIRMSVVDKCGSQRSDERSGVGELDGQAGEGNWRPSVGKEGWGPDGSCRERRQLERECQADGVVRRAGQGA
jgi:hypothetical protein